MPQKADVTDLSCSKYVVRFGGVIGGDLNSMLSCGYFLCSRFISVEGKKE